MLYTSPLTLFLPCLRGGLQACSMTSMHVRRLPVARFGVQRTCTTSLTSGMVSRILRSMPIFRVIVLLGQLPQAPCRRTFTTGPSISTTSTLPPSAIRNGRSSSSTFSTFSLVSGSVSELMDQSSYETQRNRSTGLTDSYPWVQTPSSLWINTTLCS